jgi:hypothetical protein
MSTIPERIGGQLVLALENLNLCELVCKFLVNNNSHTIPTEVRMTGIHGAVIIPGENCGFVTTPVIHAAILDIRRSIEFLGLRYDHGKRAMAALRAPRYSDDYRISDLGTAPVMPDEFNELAQQLCGCDAPAVLGQVIEYANKQMAHFSKAEGNPDIADLRSSCELLREAILTFVYDRLDIDRPKLHPNKNGR